jgi:DNA repair protein RadC
MNTPIDELSSDPALGGQGAIKIAAVLRLIVQAAYAPLTNTSVINSYDSLITYLHWSTGRKRRERVRLLSLDVRHHLLCDETLAEGSSSLVQLDITTIVRQAVKNWASFVILVHNHPTGTTNPSDLDNETTGRVERACEAIGIKLMDHIIVGSGKWHSYRLAGLLR